MKVVVRAVLPLALFWSQTAPATDDLPTVDARVEQQIARMTRDEKLTLVFGYFGTDFPSKQYQAPAEAREGSAGYIPGIPRLGIPAQWQTDAGIGVATQGGSQTKRERTALPSNVAIAATWDEALARAGGQMIGEEARRSGFNVMLAGGVNLAREPRNGRNFEYGGEDPLLAGTMVGAQIAGIQSNAIVATIKHFAINDQETDRDTGNSVIEPGAARTSDLLAFQIALERSRAGAVMCSYNRVNGTHACENSFLLSDVLKNDWGFKGYVMSDWGGTHSTVAAANAGLDQDSGFPFDKEPYFGAPLKQALTAGSVAPARLDDMARRILRSLYASGAVDRPVSEQPIDYAAHAIVTRQAAERSIVLLKNDKAMLPLSPKVRRIVVIGGHSDKGVLAGGGSSLVYPAGGNAVPGIAPISWPGPVMYYPSSPLAAIKRAAPDAEVSFSDGSDAAASAAAARAADVAIVFATQWAGEAFDVSLTLPDKQDDLIAAVAKANPRTVVVLETGAAVLTPWRDKIAGLVAAWYPGTQGGDAIANVLFGVANPSGRLPISFPASLDQLPHPATPNAGDTVYSEGATVGYKWYDKQGTRPAYAFGHGLSYTRFAFDRLTVRAVGKTFSATARVRNTGSRAGVAVPQFYVSTNNADWEAPKRLGGWQVVPLAPGEARTVNVAVDPRLLATWNETKHQWRIAGGTYRVTIATSAVEPVTSQAVTLPEATLAVGWHPDGETP